jgi:uncharacterized membrane protein
MNAEHKEQSVPAAGLFGGLRTWASRNPATERLVAEAQQYAQAKGEQLLRGAGQRLVGAIERAGTGAAIDQATNEAAGTTAKGGSPVRSLLSGATGAVRSVLGQGGQDDEGAEAPASGRTSTNIIEDIDVGVPVSVAYNQWTQFQEFSDFIKGVEGIDAADEVKSTWRVKVGPSRRSWEGEITEQIPDRRIAWTSQGAKGSTKGVVSFHPLADDLTRVMVVMEYTPVGPVERIGDMMRLQLRRVRLDLREYKKFISMRSEETGAWRGEIRDGRVVGAVEAPEEVAPEDEAPEEGAPEEEAPEEEGAEEAEGPQVQAEETEHPAAGGSSSQEAVPQQDGEREQPGRAARARR